MWKGPKWIAKKKCKEGFDTREDHKEITQTCQGGLKERQSAPFYSLTQKEVQWDLFSGKCYGAAAVDISLGQEVISTLFQFSFDQC